MFPLIYYSFSQSNFCKAACFSFVRVECNCFFVGGEKISKGKVMFYVSLAKPSIHENARKIPLLGLQTYYSTRPWAGFNPSKFHLTFCVKRSSMLYGMFPFHRLFDRSKTLKTAVDYAFFHIETFPPKNTSSTRVSGNGCFFVDSFRQVFIVSEHRVSKNATKLNNEFYRNPLAQFYQFYLV